MVGSDIFVGHLAFPLGDVKMNEVISETKFYERKYGDIYKTEVISTYYNEVGIIFSIEEADEDDALEYFEKQQAEIYGTMDMDEFNKQFRQLLNKKNDMTAALREPLALAERIQKEITEFEKTFDVNSLSMAEKEQTQDKFHELRNLYHNLNYIKRTLKML